MKIDKKKLIELLAEKTGMDRKEIEVQMDQLIDRILDAAERGKALEIKEFGLFYFDQNNELKFEPSEELTTEISFKYAGMKPVELKPERSTGIPPEIEDFESDESESDVQVVNKTEQTEQTEPAPNSKDAASGQNSQKPSNPKPRTAAAARKPVTRKKDRSFVWGTLAFLLVLVIGAAIYYYMQSEEAGQMAGENETVPEQQFQTTNPLPELSDQDEATVTDPLSAEDPVPATEQSVTRQVQASQEPERSSYGLSGEWNSSVSNPYSIVVHSFYNEFRANEVAAGLENEGYRTTVTERMVDDLEVWRVSIGQFQSLEEAQNSAATLPQPYNTEHFIQRIQ